MVFCLESNRITKTGTFPNLLKVPFNQKDLFAHWQCRTFNIKKNDSHPHRLIACFVQNTVSYFS